MSSIPLSLYIHMPWCIQKCPYCDFNSHKSPEHLPETDYINALLADLAHDLQHSPPRDIQSIFIGGGTPSLFSAEAYERLFNQLKKQLTFSPEIEITLEANPGTVEQARFQDYRQLGINRLSLGIQSFNALHLKKLGRIHDDKQAHTAIDVARQAGFNNLNLDLMYGLPDQTLQAALEDLKTALNHQPEHLSWYHLTIEPNTIFYKKRPNLPNEDLIIALEEEAYPLLAESGLQRYEISAFSQPDKTARHNLNYWLFGDYYGIGAGAHGKISTHLPQQIIRTMKYRQPKDYLQTEKGFIAHQEIVKQDDLLFEFMLNATRLEAPLPYQLITERTGLLREDFQAILESAAKAGFLFLHENTWQVSPFGRQFTNDLQALFLR